MGKLQVLPAQIANMIAAGEVVQRPASVVKELMENAIDAGATKVNVILSDSGRTLVQVIDNGAGMTPSDAVLCFERHATSKIATGEDLGRILTFGFRGEALASIAAVSEITLKTRSSKSDTAVQVNVSDFGKVTTSTVAAPVGSNFAVRNLFYNTPARRKFLKSDSSELKHCIDEFSRIALTRPEIEFTLTNNGRDIYSLKKAKSLKFRVQDVMGAAVAGDLVDVGTETSVLKLSGFVGRPESSRKTAGNQFFFVNGRYFRSPYLHKAVMKAYENLIPEGVTPSYFLYMEIDPSSVDVNIHPTKTEVKFEDESVIFQIIYASIKETLGRNSFGAEIDFEAEADVQMPSIGTSFSEYRGEALVPSPEFDDSYDPFTFSASAASEGSIDGGIDGGVGAFPSGGHAAPGQPYSSFVRKSDSYGALFEENTLPSTRVLIVKEKYILTRSASGVMAVNIHRALERVKYEESLRALSKNEHVTQTALFPVQVQIGASRVALLSANADTLQSLGFDITPFGSDTVVVGGVPEGCSCEPGKVEEMVHEIVSILSEGTSPLPEVMTSRLAAGFATLAAGSSQPMTNPFEAQKLIDALFACDSPELTPSGRRTVAIINVEQIDKLF